MEFLRALEAVRTPAASAFMAAVTYMGDEIMLMVFAVTVFWCVSKRQGYYIFAVGLGGTAINQWLKLLCRIPRPWVLDPSFTIVESARAAATGYSFPSGHTQNIVGSLGCIAMANRQKWLRALCAVFILLVPFSRMYLGVHTPLDVGVSFALAIVLILALWRFFRDDEQFRRTARAVLLGLLTLCVSYAAWVNLTRFPTDVDADNLAHGLKNGWTLVGCSLGLLVCYARTAVQAAAGLRAAARHPRGLEAGAEPAVPRQCCGGRVERVLPADKRRALLCHGGVRRLRLAADVPVLREARKEIVMRKSRRTAGFFIYACASRQRRPL